MPVQVSDIRRGGGGQSMTKEGRDAGRSLGQVRHVERLQGRDVHGLQRCFQWGDALSVEGPSGCAVKRLHVVAVDEIGAEQEPWEEFVP